MPESSPWDGISVPAVDFNVRQVTSNTLSPCFWGRDRNGACLFILELHGNHTAQYRRNAVSVNGVVIDLRGNDGNRQHLVLALEKETDRDIFEGLCRSLVSALEHATDSVSSLSISMAHIRRWKTFLSGRSQHLSDEEIRGLFAELSFLLELMDQGIAAAVDSWLGPEKSHQDFIFGNTAVEIKSLSGTERNTVRISSEDQLESLKDDLFLRIYRLSSLPNAVGAKSLNEIVSIIQARLVDAEGVEAFDRKLVAHGYAPLPDYDAPTFVISKVTTYRVGESFPRLVRSRLPPGIVGTTYDVRLETLAGHECDGAEVFRSE